MWPWAHQITLLISTVPALALLSPLIWDSMDTAFTGKETPNDYSSDIVEPFTKSDVGIDKSVKRNSIETMDTPNLTTSQSMYKTHFFDMALL